MTTEEKKIRQMPKGGRKGGISFPRVSLKDALGYARKLVSKTHTNPQPKDVIFSGVVGAKSGIGDVRLSALKQYGFLRGDTKSNFSAEHLAKQIAAAPQEELIPLYRQAMLKPAVFKKLFDTFHGDAVTKAKLKQRAADLKVHPDEAETCVELYISGMTTAGLVTVVGDRVTHIASSEIPALPIDSTVSGADFDLPGETLTNGEFETEAIGNSSTDAETATSGANGTGTNIVPPTLLMNASKSSQRAVFNVNVTLDSSMDIEKLQKQLELLKRFGAI